MKGFQMKSFLGLFLTAALIAASATVHVPAAQAAGLVRNQPFVKTIYLATPSGDESGRSYGNAKQLDASADLWAIDAGTQITSVQMIVDEAVIGTSTGKIGDDDDDDAFVRAVDITSYLATPGMLLGLGAQVAGGFLQGSTGAGSSMQRYYRTSGKEVKWVPTGTLGETGKVRVVIRGFRHAVD